MESNNLASSVNRKSKTSAITSFIFGLTFWIPLLNLIFGALAVYLGIKSIVKIRRDPVHNGGTAYAAVGLILGSLVYLTYLTGVGMCLFGYKSICGNIGLSFLA